MAINSRRKGVVGERELAAKLREYGYDTRRGQQYCGANGDADVVGVPGMHIECKRTEKLYPYKFIEQAVEDAKDGEVPVVMFRANGKYWLAITLLDDFMEVWKSGRLQKID